jgi:hypothetical protein
VSPSWNDRLLIAVRPDRIILLHMARGWRPTVKAKAIMSCLQDDQSPKWKAAIAALADILQQKEWKRTRVDVVLSQHFVRSTLVPANLALKNREEEETFALHSIAQANSDLAGEWRLRFADARPGIPKLACAVEGALLDTLEHTVAAADNKLASVRPYFVAAYDGRRRQLAKQSAWFVALESDRCCLMRLQDGLLQRISSRRIFASAETELPAFLEQERLLAQAGDLPDKVFLAAPEHHRLAFPPTSSWTVTALPIHFCDGLSPHTDAPYGMALEAGA